MRALVRIYIPNKDKANIEVADLQAGLAILGKTEEDIKQKVEWLSCEDVFFHDTQNYIRIINK